MFFGVLFLISSSYIQVTKPLKYHLSVLAELGQCTPVSEANNGQWLFVVVVLTLFGLCLG